MTKNATVWIPTTGEGDVSNAFEGDYMLLETASHILLETGDDMLVEDTDLTPKSATVWSET